MAKSVVETSLLCFRWRNLWKSLSHPIFDKDNFSRISDFSIFISQFLRHRDQGSDTFNCTWGLIQPTVINKIAVYGAKHNLHKLNISSDTTTSVYAPRNKDGDRKYPASLFTSKSLRHLCLESPTSQTRVLKLGWNLSALTTLFLKGVTFGFSSSDGSSKSIDLFSNLMNLKNLTLIDCRAFLRGIHLISPQLENLHIATRHDCELVISAPTLTSFKYEGHKPQQISANDFQFLDKVYLNMDGYILHKNYQWEQRVCREIVHMFHQLREARFITLTLKTVEVLSWILKLLEKQPSPFCKLECLKIEEDNWRKKSTLSTGVLTYLCNSSPSSTVVNECSRFFPGT